MITWNDLRVENEGENAGTLGDMVANCPANLDDAVIRDGAITEWPDYLIHADGEEPSWDTPRGKVCWDGFEVALNAARGQ